jgi:AhpD family alkylhydroperoxidase
MSRQDVDREMQQMFGTELSPLDRVPDEFIDSVWDLLKRVAFGETLIPNKYKELIGVAVAAATRCRYGALLHAELARCQGATAAEVAEAVHYASVISAWEIQLAGAQVDENEFASQVTRATTCLEERMRA